MGLKPYEHVQGRGEAVARAKKRGTGAHHLDEGESLVFQSGAQDTGQAASGAHGLAGHKVRPRRRCQRAQVEGAFRVAERRGLGELARGGRSGELPAGHAVIVVVYDDRGKVYVATGRVDQVVAADGGPVAVTHERNHA